MTTQLDTITSDLEAARAALRSAETRAGMIPHRVAVGDLTLTPEGIAEIRTEAENARVRVEILEAAHRIEAEAAETRNVQAACRRARTLLAERPDVEPHIERMAAALAEGLAALEGEADDWNRQFESTLEALRSPASTRIDPATHPAAHGSGVSIQKDSTSGAYLRVDTQSLTRIGTGWVRGEVSLRALRLLGEQKPIEA
ncbi:hypothetical protein [Sinomonas sp. B1-1]|uniref:hypothetical protein n=1 Tax=Sinomonas sp. B1-1 TaxID=3141454 RepID=UPI003D284189